jgi:hypothetical protein
MIKIEGELIATHINFLERHTANRSLKWCSVKRMGLN